MTTHTFPNEVFTYTTPNDEEIEILDFVVDTLAKGQVLFAYYSRKPSNFQWYFQTYKTGYLLYLRDIKYHTTKYSKRGLSMLQIKCFCVNVVRADLKIDVCRPLIDDDRISCTTTIRRCNKNLSGFVLPDNTIISHVDYYNKLFRGQVDIRSRDCEYSLGLLRSRHTFYSDCSLHCSNCKKFASHRTLCGHYFCSYCIVAFKAKKRSLCPTCLVHHFLDGVQVI